MHRQPPVLSATATRPRADHRYALVGVLALLTLLLVLSPAHGSTLSLHPTRLYLEGDSTTSLVIKNRGDYPVLIQARVMSWSDQAGNDLLEPSSGLIAWPPIIEVDAHAQQVVRVAPTEPNESDLEAAYRLLVSEVPRGRVDASAPGVRFALQFSLPVFVRPEDVLVEPSLLWALERTGESEMVVSATNVGTAHTRIMGVVVRGTDDPALIARIDDSRYLLPGARRSWRLTAEKLEGFDSESVVSIEAESDNGLLTTSVPVSADGMLSASTPEPAKRPGR